MGLQDRLQSKVKSEKHWKEKVINLSKLIEAMAKENEQLKQEIQ